MLLFLFISSLLLLPVNSAAEQQILGVYSVKILLHVWLPSHKLHPNSNQ